MSVLMLSIRPPKQPTAVVEEAVRDSRCGL